MLPYYILKCLLPILLLHFSDGCDPVFEDCSAVSAESNPAPCDPVFEDCSAVSAESNPAPCDPVFEDCDTKLGSSSSSAKENDCDDKKKTKTKTKSSQFLFNDNPQYYWNQIEMKWDENYRIIKSYLKISSPEKLKTLTEAFDSSVSLHPLSCILPNFEEGRASLLDDCNNLGKYLRLFLV